MPGHSPPPSTGTTSSEDTATRPGLHLNWEDWLPFFEHPDISLEDKKKQIEALWTILMCFADANYDLLGPDDLAAEETSGQVLDLTAALHKAVLNSQEANEPESEEV